MKGAGGYGAYGQSQILALEGARLEAEALVKAARLLQAALDAPGDLRRLGQALDFNTKLWTVFEADLTAPGSALPPEPRGQLLALCRFMNKSTAVVLARFDADTVSAMIEVNRDLAGGLLQRKSAS